jgi:hypothetical protein
MVWPRAIVFEPRVDSMRTVSGYTFLFFVILIPLPLGCGGSSYKFAPVSGCVTLDGHPVAGAEIRFFPASAGQDAPTSMGVTDDQGNYELYVLGGDAPGAIVGENHVTISQNQQNKEFMRQRMAQQKGGHVTRPRELIPSKYNHDSKLTCTVPPEGKKDANFDLTSR